MKSPAIVIILCFSTFLCFGQEVSDITTSIDELTATWDEEAEVLKTYDGMKGICRSQPHRAKTINLVKEIHHYDSVLYKTVKSKFDENKDAEAKATLQDIKKLESDYTTAGFLKFIHTECSVFNDIERVYARAGGKPYEKEKLKMEKELSKYVEEVTQQIDIIDEHIHHLDNL